MKRTLRKLLNNPLIILGKLLRCWSVFFKNDELYLKLQYFFYLKRWPNIKNPRTYNEKLLWLKLHNKKREYSIMVDKYEVKGYVREILGEEYIIPTLGIYNKFNEIDFQTLPDKFVLKCTHDSGGVFICNDKKHFDINKVRRKIDESLKKNFYYDFREYPYKDVSPRIIVEQFMVDESGVELKDYKFFCFNGEPRMLLLASDRSNGTRMNFYDMNFALLPVYRKEHPNSNDFITKPKGFEEMIKLAKILSKDIPHVRVDFYDINGKIYFGELTFFSASGLVPFYPQEWNEIIGNWLILPDEK